MYPCAFVGRGAGGRGEALRPGVLNGAAGRFLLLWAEGPPAGDPGGGAEPRFMHREVARLGEYAPPGGDTADPAGDAGPEGRALALFAESGLAPNLRVECRDGGQLLAHTQYSLEVLDIAGRGASWAGDWLFRTWAFAYQGGEGVSRVRAHEFAILKERAVLSIYPDRVQVQFASSAVTLPLSGISGRACRIADGRLDIRFGERVTCLAEFSSRTSLEDMLLLILTAAEIFARRRAREAAGAFGPGGSLGPGGGLGADSPPGSGSGSAPEGSSDSDGLFQSLLQSLRVPAGPPGPAGEPPPGPPGEPPWGPPDESPAWPPVQRPPSPPSSDGGSDEADGPKAPPAPPGPPAPLTPALLLSPAPFLSPPPTPPADLQLTMGRYSGRRKAIQELSDGVSVYYVTGVAKCPLLRGVLYLLDKLYAQKGEMALLGFRPGEPLSQSVAAQLGASLSSTAGSMLLTQSLGSTQPLQSTQSLQATQATESTQSLWSTVSATSPSQALSPGRPGPRSRSLRARASRAPAELRLPAVCLSTSAPEGKREKLMRKLRGKGNESRLALVRSTPLICFTLGRQLFLFLIDKAELTRLIGLLSLMGINLQASAQQKLESARRSHALHPGASPGQMRRSISHTPSRLSRTQTASSVFP